MLGIPDWFLVLITIVCFFYIKSKANDTETPENSDPQEISEFCEGNICKNTCDRINASSMKSGGANEFNYDVVDPTKPENQFSPSSCDPGTKLLTYNSQLCGGDGERECTSDECCIPKMCENDIIPFTVTGMGEYLNRKGLGVDGDGNPLTDPEIQRLYNSLGRLDGDCPYQQTIMRDTNCTGVTGVGQDCTQAECCRPKTCSTDWSGTADWSGGGQTCPSVNTKIKYDDDLPCDTCDDTDCCYTPSLYCSVSTADPSNAGNHTNIREVPISGTNYDLTEDALDILKKTNLDAPRKAEIDLAITCSTDYQYGMCDGSAGSDPATSTCNTHDNNERLCLSNGCEFRRGDHPRVSYVGCDNGADQNSILVGNCINTCTADVSLADPTDLSTYFFVGGQDAATAATAATAAAAHEAMRRLQY